MQLENPYENQHRLLKAVRIVNALEELNVPLQEAQHFDKKHQLAVSAYVEAGPPSKETWEIVCDLYKKRVSHPFQ